jgi:hypothetical protein
MAIAISRGWVVFDPLPSYQEVVLFFPFLAFLVLGLLAWLDQRIWPSTRPLRRAPSRSNSARDSAVREFLLAAMAALGLGHQRPDETKVLPLPEDLALVSRSQDCGSEACGVSYVLTTPDRVAEGELTARLWRHLERPGLAAAARGRVLPRHCWIHPVHQCLFLRQDTPGLVTLSLSTVLDLAPEVGVGSVG